MNRSRMRHTGNTGKLNLLPGERIRRQYFNIPIYTLLSMYAAVLSAWTAASIMDHTFGSVTWFTDILPWFVIAMVILLPFLLLSALNRCCFGKVICVLDDKGLHYFDNDIRFIAWRDIKRVSYEPDIPTGGSRHGFMCCNTAYITTKPFKKEIVIELDHAPYLLLGKMKKHNPNAKYGFTKLGLLLVLFYALGPSLLFALAMLS